MQIGESRQTGRSMVEMLGVLAIIGVLSVGGISAYSKAMAKFKLTKAQDQISMILMNIRTAFAPAAGYSGLNNSTAVSHGVAPTDMVSDISGSAINHAFGGLVRISATDSAGEASSGSHYFYIAFDHVGYEACLSLASSDWGTDGLARLIVTPETGSGGGNFSVSDLPRPLTATGCGGKGSFNTLKWVYY